MGKKCGSIYAKGAPEKRRKQTQTKPNLIMRSLIATSLLLITAAAYAQPKAATTDAKYRRSSLYTLMINNPNRPHADEILNAFTNSPIPDKFNDHVVGD